MNFSKNILETIGNTPLVQLNSVAKNLSTTILAKVEYLNPGGSTKDRIAVKILLEAEKEGLVKPGSTIVEPTSGNTGVGLALVAALKGYKLICTMPDKMSKDKVDLLKAYGAEVIITPTDVKPEDPKSYYKVAEKVLKETPNSFSPNQYFNQNNPLAHYETTGPEIWRDTDGKITHFVAGIGTGGTMTGVAKYLKEQNADIKIIGADPEGSIYYSEFKNEEPDIHTYKTEGIGEDFMPETIDLSLLDDIVVVSDKDAFSMARKLVKEEGLFVGSSSGSAVYAAFKVAADLDENKIIVVLLPDTGRNYLSTLYNDEWMNENNLF